MTTQHLKKATAALLAAALIIPQGSVAVYAAEVAVKSPAPAVFSGVDVSEDQVTIKLSSAVQYNSFLTQTPPRLVLELLDTKHQAAVRATKGKGEYLAGVRTSQFQRTPRLVTRVVLDLVKMAVYKVSATAQGLAVQLVGSGASPATAPSEPVTPVAAAPEAPEAPAAPAAPEAAEAPEAAQAPAAKVASILPPAPESTAMPVVTPKAAAAPEPKPTIVVDAPPVKARDASAAAALRRAGLA